MSSVEPPSTNLWYLKHEISEADERCIPSLLLQLRDFLSPLYGRERHELIQEIWKMSFPDSLMKSLLVDFTHISGVWKTACELVSLTIDLTVESEQDNIISFASNLMLSILQIITKILKEHSQVEKTFQANLCSHLATLVTSSATLMKTFRFLSSNVLSSKHFMQLLMVELEDISLLAISLLKTTLTSNKDALAHVSESRVHNIVDEIAFKITATKFVDVARVSLDTLLFMVDSYQPLLELFSSKRYRGFKTYITKWIGHGFDYTIHRFLKVLDKQLCEQDELRKFHQAATMIQSVYRGHVTRARLLNANIAITKFHQFIRTKKKLAEKEKERDRHAKLRKNHVESRRRKEFVNSKVKQLKIIEKIPAKTVDKFFTQLQNNAAVKIQAAWFGWKARHKFKQQQPTLKTHHAAKIIQKCVRRWLAKCRKERKEALLELLPEGLTDERKVQLQKVIGNIRERFPKRVCNDEEFQASHEQTFQMLANHIAGLHTLRRRDEHRKALVAQLSLQSELLRNMPSLRDVEERHVEMYASKSAPVVIAGRQKHFDLLADLKKPWWARLDEERIDYETNIRPEVRQDPFLF